MIDPGTGTKSVPAVEQLSESSVNEKKVDQIVSDAELASAIKTETVVEGVKLTTQEVKSGTNVVAQSGMQAVVDAAKEEKPAIADALLKDDASVTVRVDVVVSPTKYEAQEESAKTIAFKLEPKATVTVTTATSTESAVVKVTNDMIDQAAGIAATIVTGFKPVTIVHKDDFGRVIETFTEDEIVYDEVAKTATVYIHHFSTLEASNVPCVAMTDGAPYETLADAFAAVGDAESTISLVRDVALTEAVTLAAGKTATFDFGNRTITGGGITSAGALTLKGGVTSATTDLACTGSGTMAITGGTYNKALPAPADPAATNAGPFLVSGGMFVSKIPLAYCAQGYLPKENVEPGTSYYSVLSANVYIRSITAAQRYPWNGYVDINFDVCWDREKPARLFVFAYDGSDGDNSLANDPPLKMTEATVIVDGVAMEVDCSQGFEIAAQTVKSVHLMWQSTEAVEKGTMKEGVRFEFIAK